MPNYADSRFRVRALFLAKDADRAASKPAETANDCRILTKLPVPRKRREIA